MKQRVVASKVNGAVSLSVSQGRSPEDQLALEEVMAHWNRKLLETPAALEALQRRGVTEPGMVERFKLGYAHRTLADLLPPKAAKSGKEKRRQLESIGILSRGGYATFASSIIVPIFDKGGQVADVYAYRIWSLSPSTPVHRWLPGPHEGVFNLDAVKLSKAVIVTEHPLAALAFWSAGFRNVTSTYGVGDFTALLAAMKEQQTAHALIAFKRDAAGDQGAAAFASALGAAGIGAWQVEFPKTMNANTYAVRLQPANKSLGLVLRNARWMGSGAVPANPIGELQIGSIPPPPQASAGSLPAAEVGEVGKKLKPTRAQPPSAPPDRSHTIEGPVGSVPVETGAAEPPASRPATPPPSPTTTTPPAATAAAIAVVEVEARPEEVVLRIEDRKYRVRGLAKNLSYDVMKVTLYVGRGEQFFLDTVDLVSAKARQVFVKQAAVELGLGEEVIRRDLGKVLLKLEAVQEENIQRVLAPKKLEPTMTPEEAAAALELLRDPRLLDRVLEDFEQTGLVGEETSKLVAYLASVSRKLDDPLSIVIQSSSSAGKSSLLEAVLSFVPDEDKSKFSALTPKALYYAGETSLRHKVLAVVEEQGASDAYALKLLLSEHELTVASTGRDAVTGRMVTEEYKVRGPVAMLVTSTAVDIDEELMNRALVLAVSEDRGQTRAIHQLQRHHETLEGLLGAKAKERVVRLHQNAQRLLKPVAVVNPFADQLTFMDHGTRSRRDFKKYLGLIKTIAFVRQHQRPLRTTERAGDIIEYIEVELADIELANRLAHEVLGRCIDDLPPQSRSLLIQLDKMVAEVAAMEGAQRSEVRFTRRQVREYTGRSYPQLRIHLDRLREREHLILHAGSRGKTHVYELLFDGAGGPGVPILPGLIDVAQLRSVPTSLGPNRPLSGL